MLFFFFFCYFGWLLNIDTFYIISNFEHRIIGENRTSFAFMLMLICILSNILVYRDFFFFNFITIWIFVHILYNYMYLLNILKWSLFHGFFVLMIALIIIFSIRCFHLLWVQFYFTTFNNLLWIWIFLCILFSFTNLLYKWNFIAILWNTFGLDLNFNFVTVIVLCSNGLRKEIYSKWNLEAHNKMNIHL